MTDLVEVALLRGSLDHCVKCTICETACPVSNATPLFPGPKYAGPQSERYRVAGEPSVDASVDYCSGCGICSQVCPQGVKIAEINAQARNDAQAPARACRCATASSPDRPGSGAPAPRWRRWPTGAALAAAAASWPRGARRAPRRAGTALRRAPLLPLGAHPLEPARRPARRVLPRLRHRVLRAVGGRAGRRRARAQRLRGGRAQAGLLRAAAAIERIVRRRAPVVQATGAPARPPAERPRHAHRRQRDELHADAQARGAGDPRRSRTTRLCAASAERTYDICELLLELHQRGELRTDFKPLPERVAYHAPCQQQGHWIGKPALELLALIPDLDVREMSARCCGIAGTYGLKAEKYEIAMAVGRSLFEQVDASGAATVACDSETCRWQITHGTDLPSVHPIDLPVPGLRAGSGLK